jgi:hypothetical protein
VAEHRAGVGAGHRPGAKILGLGIAAAAVAAVVVGSQTPGTDSMTWIAPP